MSGLMGDTAQKEGAVEILGSGSRVLVESLIQPHRWPQDETREGVEGFQGLGFGI
jgi:hypothetical protein